MVEFTTKYEMLARAAITIVVTLAWCLAAYVAFAATAESAETVTATVSIADLDLSSPAGAATLYKRIKSAARKVCGPQTLRPLNAVPKQQRTWRDCFEEAVADAVSRANKPLLTALHTEESKRPTRG
jgi:UrcA family protein